MAGDLALSTGIMSGIDTGQLVESLTIRQKQTINMSERKQHTLQIQKQEYQTVNSALTALEDSMLQLSLSNTYNRKEISFGMEGYATATATTAAEVGDYSLEILDLAQTHKVASDKQDSSTGSLTSNESIFKINGVSLTVSEGVSLSDLNEAINGTHSQTGVSSNIINNTLVLTADEAGESNAISLEDVSGGFLESIGLITSSANNTSEIETGDIKGTLHEGIASPGFSVEKGFIAINDTSIYLNPDDATNPIMDLGDVANAINNAGIDGVTAEVENDKLRIFDATGTAVFKDVVGGNLASLGITSSDVSQLSGADSVATFYESGAGVSFTAGDFTIDGNTINLSGGETIEDVRDLINAAGITDVSASVKDGKLRIGKAGGEPVITDTNGNNMAKAGLESTPSLTSQLAASDATGYVYRSGAAPAFSDGVMRVGTTDVTLTSGMNVTDAVNAINSALTTDGVTGIQAFEQDGTLRIYSDGGAASITDVSGTNAADLSMSPAYAYNNSDETISINGENIIIPAFADINTIHDAINAVSGTTGVSTITTGGGPVQLELSGTDSMQISGALATKMGIDADFSKSVAQSYTTSAETLTIDGEDISIDAFATLQEISDAINAQSSDAFSSSITSDVPPQLLLSSQNGTTVSSSGNLASVLNFAPLNSSSTKEVYNTDEQKLSINGTEITIAAYSSLQEITDAINAESAGTGVSASIVNVDGQDQIEFTHTDDFYIKDVSGSLAADLGFRGESTFNHEIQTAQDARFKLNGLEITRDSNKIDDVIEGVTLTLQQETTSKMNMEVNYDTAYTRTQFENFIERYNQAIDLVYTKLNYKKDYDIEGLTTDEKAEMSEDELEEHEDSLRKQALSGDSILQRAYSTLRSVTYMRFDTDSEINSLSSMGISTGSVGSDYHTTQMGKLQIVDQSAFDDALKYNVEDIRSLFVTEGTEDNSKTQGIAQRLKASIKEFTASDGYLTKKAGRPGAAVSSSLLDVQIATLAEEILNKNKSLLEYQQSLLLQFQNMETALADLQDQQNALAQQSGGV